MLAINSHNPVDIAYIDFSKAFDPVSAVHSIHDNPLHLDQDAVIFTPESQFKYLLT